MSVNRPFTQHQPESPPPATEFLRACAVVPRAPGLHETCDCERAVRQALLRRSLELLTQRHKGARLFLRTPDERCHHARVLSRKRVTPDLRQR